MVDCPKCRKIQHPVCGRKNCYCRKSIPAGELPQIWVFFVAATDQDGHLFSDAAKCEVTEDTFMSLWNYRIDHSNEFETMKLIELIRCPYCGFEETEDFWFARDVEMNYVQP